MKSDRLKNEQAKPVDSMKKDDRKQHELFSRDSPSDDFRRYKFCGTITGWRWALRRPSRGKLRRCSLLVLRLALPSRKHGEEIRPSVQENHDQVAGNEREESAHRREMPDPREMKPAEQKCQP